MKENTPPTTPTHPVEEDDDDDLLYVEEVEEIDLNDIPDDSDSDEEPLNEPMELLDEAIPERDDSSVTFKKHTDSLFCGSFHPSGDFVVTGGEDDNAYVWATDTAEVIFEVTEHRDSVIAAEFSADGKFLATGDMAGEIRVFRVDKDYKKVWEFAMGDMTWMKWHRKAAVLVAGAESGEIYIWRIPSGDCKVLGGEGVKCETGEFTNDDKRLAAGYGDGSFKLWDIKDLQVSLHIPPEKLRDDETEVPQSITTLATDNENNLILAGCENGYTKLIGSSGLIGILTTQPMRTSAGTSDNAEETSPVEKVLIDCPDFNDVKIAVTGNLHGKVTIWDVTHQTIRNECVDDNPTGIVTMLWAKDQTVIAGTIGGPIKAWNVRNGAMKFELFGHVNNIHDISYHEKKNLLLSVSEDKTAKIFPLPL